MRSSLTNKVMPTVKHSSRRGKKISRVIVHHWAGTAGGVERLVHSGDQASANYIILSDGTLIASVPEEYRAWTSGSAAADEPSITVEVQNSTRGPEWRVSDAAITTLTRLIADVAKRYGWAKITRSNVRGHREFKATACPGPYLYPLLPKIASDAEKLRKPKPAKPKPKPKPQVASSDTGVLSLGASGGRVKNLQRGLNKVFPAYRWRSRVRRWRLLTVDGSYGPHTAEWVRLFQVAVGLTPDKVVGPKTVAALAKYGVSL